MGKDWVHLCEAAADAVFEFNLTTGDNFTPDFDFDFAGPATTTAPTTLLMSINPSDFSFSRDLEHQLDKF